MKLLLTSVACLSFSVAIAISDIATHRGFPYQKQLLNLTFEPGGADEFKCTKLASSLGENLSTFEPETGRQGNCLIVATGRLQPDGSFHAQLGWNTWTGRIRNWAYPLKIPAKDILSVKSDWRS